MRKFSDMAYKTNYSRITYDTIFYGVTSVLERAASFIMIPILTKTLSQELYGIWTQIIVTIGFLSPLLLLGFSSATIRFLSGEQDKRKISNIYHAMFLVVGMLCVLVAVFLAVSISGVSSLMFGSTEFSDFVLIFGLLLASEVMFELIMSFLRSQNYIRLISLYYLIKNCGRLLILGLGILSFKIPLPATIIAIVIFQIILVGVSYFIHIFSKIGVCLVLAKVPWKKIILFSMPLLPYGLLIWGNNFIDRYIVLHIVGIKQLSIYALSYSLAAQISLFYSIMGFTLYPHIAKLWNKGDKTAVANIVSRALQLYLFFCIPFIVILSVFSSQIVRLISTSDYISPWQVIFLLSAGIFFFGVHQLSMYPILLNDKTTQAFKLAGISMLANLLLNLMLVPSMGIVGAAMATLCSNVLLAGLTIIASKRQIALVLPWKKFRQIIIYGATMLFLLLGIKYFFAVTSIYILGFLIAAVLTFYFGLDLLKKDSFLRKLGNAL
jgi:O-antigen/teichoic acid export membrane protein